jgi:uncharacterized protein (TIGR01777 family)
MRVAISGSSGLIGTALRRHLANAGHEVVRLVRGAPGPGDVTWDPAAGRLDERDLAGIDAVVNLSGAGIGEHRWTDEYKREVLDSRVEATSTLARALADATDGPRVLLSGSAIGFYGDRGDEQLDEGSSRGTGFLAEVCEAWEHATEKAEAAGVRVVHLRTGIVLSPDGGALKKQLPLFKLGLGGRFGAGRQWQSWISIDDEVAAIEHLLTSDARGPVNLTAPNPVTNREFADTLARVLRRPSFLPVPSFGPKLLLGGELAEALLFDGQRVLPRVLEHDGYAFAHPQLEPALRALLGR